MIITINLPDNAAADLAGGGQDIPRFAGSGASRSRRGGTRIHPTDLRAQMIVVADTASPPI